MMIMMMIMMVQISTSRECAITCQHQSDVFSLLLKVATAHNNDDGCRRGRGAINPL